jgi:hypothetical protein
MPDARSSVVQHSDSTGVFYTVDVDINELGSRWTKGAAKTVRFVEGVAASTQRPASGKLLGEVPIAGDGSYHVKLPANAPVQLQLIDVDGLALRSSPWLWVRNHAAQGCVGCHEDPERTPPNRLMQAFATPAADLSVRPVATHTVSATDLAPIIESTCVPCHRGNSAAPDLTRGVAGLAPYVVPGEARRSPLMWHLLGRVTTRPWDSGHATETAKPMPAGAAAIEPAHIRAFAQWIDLGARQ